MMKTGKFLLGIFALAALAIGCDDDEDMVIPSMSIDQTTLSFGQEGGAAAAQTVRVTSNRDWEAVCDADWVVISPTSAKASSDPVAVTVYVVGNDGTDRSTKIEFTSTTVVAEVTVTQEGPAGESYGAGTADNPYTVADALSIINAGSYTSKYVYVKGIISKIDEIDTSSYGNATYYISDDGTTDEHLEVYRGYSLGGAKFTSEDEIQVGDEVIVYGELTMYGTTPEITQGSSIYYLNGVTADVGDVGDHELEGNGTVDNPYTALDALWLANSGNYTSSNVYVKGIISSITEVDTSYGNATYYISDDGTTTNQFYIYRGYSLGGARFTSTSEIKVGDEVIVYGEITMYYSTPEMTQGSSIYSLNGETSSSGGGDTGDLTGDGTLDNPYTASDALLLANSGNYTSDEVYVKGTISQIDEIDTGSYGNATYHISDDGTTTNQFEIYRGYSLNGNKFTSSTEIEVGDKVVVCGVITMYYSTPEMTTGSKIVSIEKGDGSSGGDEGGDTGDIVDATAAEVNAGSDGTTYRVAGYITSVASTTYGNFYLKDYTGQTYIYGTLDANGNTKNWESLGISAGDIVTVHGPKSTYNGTAELVDVTVDEHYPVTDVTIAEFNAASVSTEVYYRLTGTVTSIASTTYGNLYLEDETASVYVYGLPCGYGGSDKTFSETGVAEGDVITIVGTRGVYGSTIEVVNGFYVETVSSGSGGGDSGGLPTFTSNVSWTLGDKAYSETATINGTSYSVLKLGTGSAVGNATFTIPAGSTSLAFYCFGWNGKTNVPYTVTIGSDEHSLTAQGNSGFNNNSPYTVTVSDDSDHQTITFDSALTSETTVKVATTSSSNPRVVFTGINYYTD